MKILIKILSNLQKFKRNKINYEGLMSCSCLKEIDASKFVLSKIETDKIKIDKIEAGNLKPFVERKNKC